jgi:hypothetical protein
VSVHAQEESYPPDWWHATIHLHPSTGEMHSDGDHRVRQWLEARLGRPPRRLGVSTQNKRGEWVPAVPGPYLGVRKKCWACGEKFWTLDGYQGHYAYAHILGMEDSR